jgi:subtilisin family serine protease
MAYPYYLITAPQKSLEKIAKYARKLVDKRHGDPVIAVGAMRIVLMPAAVEKMLDNAFSALDPSQSQPFTEIVGAMGAQGAAPISLERLNELLAARAPEELSVARAADAAPVRDGYDWHVKITRLVEAWALLGEPGNIDWQDIRVGQIDTGFRPIPALGFGADGKSPWVLTEFDRNFYPGDFNRDDYLDYGNPPRAEDFALDPLLGAPNDGHGTRTGSVLSGFDTSKKATEAGKLKGYFGAAPQVPFIPVRISDSVIINHVQEPLARAIEHLVQHGCSVITLSMGMALTYVTARLKQAIDYAYEEGVILVCAAGNVWDPVVAPARLHRTLAVGGCTPALIPWLGSSFGPEVDVCAPAWPIRRASVDRKGNPNYGSGDGTSFATPQVAGTAALWLRYRGEEIRQNYPQKWQRVEAFKSLVKGTAQPGIEWNRYLYGAGILDARAVLDAPLPAVDSLIRDESA